jgi:predicted amidohydrolase YtcJ
VFPGFIDAHAHPWWAGVYALKSVGHPVLVEHRGGHTGFMNSLAFEKVGVTATTPDPPGGRYERDARGELDGRVADKALEAVIAHIPDELTREDHRRGIALSAKLYAAHGITSACEADARPEALQGYQDARESGELRYRCYCMPDIEALDRYIAAGVHTGFGDSMVRVGAIKQFADGSIAERTAWLALPTRGWATTSGSRSALHRGDARAHHAHEGPRRDPGAVLGLRQFSRRRAPFLRRGAHRAHVRLSLVPRCRPASAVLVRLHREPA